MRDRSKFSRRIGRRGKNVSVIFPTLMDNDASAVIFDTKGALIKSCAFKRPSMIEVETATAVDDAAVNEAARIADALVVQETGPQGHFTLAARNLVLGLMLLHNSDKEN